ncbi:hypothetical protein CYY_002305 [Polysphondylium violaceum]|uniref:CBS domain-containing protein n=1 Tax=Polysphondylium violaceum TaxID=133409 RepID=A0A8J4PZL8_9MYCE|nr:hypothetical protein CYY_002305 [Polysphondylium violaceum]
MSTSINNNSFRHSVEPNIRKSKEFESFLSKPISELGIINDLNGKPLVWVDADEPIKNAFQKLCDQSILSCPVYCKKSNQWVSIIDIKDFVRYFVSLFDRENKLIKLSEFDISIRNILTNSNGQFIRTCPMITRNENVGMLLELFEKKFHRVCVALDPNDQMNLQVVSQLSLLKWIDKHNQVLGDYGELQLEDLSLIHRHHNKPLVTINHKKLAIDAFRLMADNNIYGIPVIGDNGELVDNISVMDSKYIKMDLSKLLQPIYQFFVPNVGSAYPVPLRQPLMCDPKTRLKEAIGRIAAHKVHRIYLTKETVQAGIAQIPLRVISVSDLIWDLTNFSGLI